MPATWRSALEPKWLRVQLLFGISYFLETWSERLILGYIPADFALQGSSEQLAGTTSNKHETAQTPPWTGGGLRLCFAGKAGRGRVAL